MATDRRGKRAALQELLAAELTGLMSAEGWSVDRPRSTERTARRSRRSAGRRRRISPPQLPVRRPTPRGDAGIVNAIRAGPGAEPDSLRPPARAGYRLHPAHSSIAVTLDAGATSWVDRAHAGSGRRYGDTVQLHAWLDWDTADPDRLAVHIADHRVGVLDPASTRLYRPAMERAATRAEVPHLNAELTRRGPAYLLQIAAPAQDPANRPDEG